MTCGFCQTRPIDCPCQQDKGDPREAGTSGGLDQEGATSTAGTTVPPARDAQQVSALLDSPGIARLIADLDATRSTGRPGYPVRTMVGLAVVKSLYALPTWTRTVALVRDQAALRNVLGAVPSVHAAYRFAAKLRKHADVRVDQDRFPVASGRRR